MGIAAPVTEVVRSDELPSLDGNGPPLPVLMAGSKRAKTSGPPSLQHARARAGRARRIQYFDTTDADVGCGVARASRAARNGLAGRDDTAASLIVGKRQPQPGGAAESCGATGMGSGRWSRALNEADEAQRP